MVEIDSGILEGMSSIFVLMDKLYLDDNLCGLTFKNPQKK
jgi:hypothetical protein